MTKPIVITVLGTPAAQGSKRHVGGGRMVESSTKVGPWREAVVSACIREGVSGTCLTGAVFAELTFYFQRPKGHYGSRGLKDTAPRMPATTPDLDKVIRSTLDALTQAAVIEDDRLVVGINAVKLYAIPERPPGADIVLRESA